jgi:hypothetical protein
MDINDLQPGDVLLFSGEEGSLISKAIMWLTDAPVSHAAMAYNPSSIIVEETPPAVQTNPADERFVDRTISVMRRTPPQSNYDPVLDAAADYLNAEEPYANANLYLVGALLVYRKFTPDTPLQRIIIKILKKVAASIITYYNEHKYPGKLPMVCSQFVFQCYEDGGADYQLRIKDGVLGSTLGITATVPSLLEQAIDRIRNDTTPAFQEAISAHSGMLMAATEMQSDEELAGELLQALQAAPTMLAEAVPPLENELVVAIHEFGQALHMVRNGAAIHENELLQANAKHMLSNGMAMLKTEEAYFVTPADLLQHCPTLTEVGVISG